MACRRLDSMACYDCSKMMHSVTLQAAPKGCILLCVAGASGRMAQQASGCCLQEVSADGSWWSHEAVKSLIEVAEAAGRAQLLPHSALRLCLF